MKNRFAVEHQDPHSRARTGTFELGHGIVQTPAFMPVGTAASVKATWHRDIESLDYDIILANTYHLYLRPGIEVIAESGGLHRFSNWRRNILTDSGGYQVFSLPSFRKVGTDGVYFKSHIDGSHCELDPAKVVDLQTEFGSDVLMPLDHCTGPEVGYEESAAAVETTTRWAKLSRERWESRGAQAPISGAAKGLLFGIVQGNFFRDLRERSAAELTELDFPGYAIGGLSVGEPAELFAETLGYTAPLLPADRPRYVMGIGTPDYIFAAVENGIDMFDCVLPTRIARNGTVFTTEGRLALKNHRFEKDEAPIDPEWGHPELAGYSRAYVRHLVKSDEILGIMITTLHNLAFMKRLMVEIRRSIAEGRFSSFRDSFLARYRKVGEG